MRTVQELFRHASLSSTQIYTHVTKDALQRNYNQFHPRAKRDSKINRGITYDNNLCSAAQRTFSHGGGRPGDDGRIRHHEGTAKKIRRIYHDEVIVGFAGGVADAFTLEDKFERETQSIQRQPDARLNRGAKECAVTVPFKSWRRC